MASAIEAVIEEIIEYIDSCKMVNFSSSKIAVNKDDIDALLDELKMKTPDEIRRYQKIISNQEAILADAKKKADAIISAAQVQTNELVSEHQIMQQAYAQANEVVMIATKQATEMLDNATREANEIRVGAISYTDSLLKSIQEVLVTSIDTTKSRTDNYLNTMQGYLDVVVANRLELSPNPQQTVTQSPMTEAGRVMSSANNPSQSTLSKEKTPMQTMNPAITSKTTSGVEPKPRTGAGQTGVIDIPEEFFNKK